VAADAELRRRHPEQRLTPLRAAEPQPGNQAQRDELTLTAGQPIPEMGQWLKDLAASHRAFAQTLAERLSYRRNGMSIFVLLLYSGYAWGKVAARFRSSTVPQ
jgi:hypothetical protein